MCTLHFHCPAHHRDIDSGIEVEERTLEQTRLNLVHVPCPWCGKTHRFLLADAQQGVAAA